MFLHTWPWKRDTTVRVCTCEHAHLLRYLDTVPVEMGLLSDFRVVSGAHEDGRRQHSSIALKPLLTWRSTPHQWVFVFIKLWPLIIKSLHSLIVAVNLAVSGLPGRPVNPTNAVQVQSLKFKMAWTDSAPCLGWSWISSLQSWEKLIKAIHQRLPVKSRTITYYNNLLSMPKPPILSM